MAETYPNPNSEPEPHSNKSGGGKSEKGAPGAIKKVGGVTPLQFGDKILLARSIDGGLLRPTEHHEPRVAGAHEQSKPPEHEHGEREDWRPVSAQELHDRAVVDQQAHLEAMHILEHTVEVDKKSDSEGGAEKPKKGVIEDIEKKQFKAAQEHGQPESIEGILSPQSTGSSDGHTDKAPLETTRQVGPDAEQNPEQPAGTETAFQEMTQGPELADLGTIELPKALLSTETSEKQPVLDDEIFRDMITNETGEDPGEAQLHEHEPGLPPVEMSDSDPEPFSQWLQGHPELTPLANTNNAAVNSAPGNSNGTPNSPGFGSPHGSNPNMPNQPPHGNGNGGNLPPGGPPNPNAGAWNNGPNIPFNPNALNNPWAPAGNILNPAVLAGMSALEARRQLDSLRHTAREAGLAGAIGILGLGLVIEHFRTSKTRRMLKKQGKEHTRALAKTTQALQQERYAHQAAKAKLEHLDAAQAATSEQLRRTSEALNHPEHVRRSATGAERVAGTGLISAAAAAELAANASKKHELRTNEQLAKQLGHDKELGRAIKRNPELRDIADLASTTAAEQREFNQEVREVADMNLAADALTEKRYEQLQVRGSRDGGGTQSGGADVRGPSSLPTPQRPSGDLSTLTTPQQRASQDKMDRRNLATNPVAWATVVVIIAAIVMAIIVH